MTLPADEERNIYRKTMEEPVRLWCCVVVVLQLLWWGVPEADAWQPKHAPIETRWAAKVDPEHVLPEYPRPQLARTEWLNLNGVWEYQPGAAGDAVPAGKKLSGEILTPFPVESALSGVVEHHDRLWYRRTFEVPKGWVGRRVVLNFGAVDYESEVFVNGQSVGVHKGGYDPFAFDITDALKPEGKQELIVRVYDPTEAGGQPRGKQTTTPGGIMYTPTTGIWQTVWIEPVARKSIESLHIVPDVAAGVVRIAVDASAEAKESRVRVEVFDAGKLVATKDGRAGAELTIRIAKAKLWSPESPFLYDVKVTLLTAGAPADEVTSYFGMRTVSVGEIGGAKRVLLNGKPIFLFGPLDQGFWPDGIYTAPTDDAIRNDLAQVKAFGFNMVRKHIKVEPYRWYYWADKLGVLVWQDMPSENSYMGKDKAGTVTPERAEFESELQRMIRTHWNSPSIITWVVFNEGQGQPEAEETIRLVNEVRSLDASRLVNEASGGKIYGSGDFNDVHSYPAPNVRPVQTAQVYVCGEYGGIGMKVPEHMWEKNKGGGYANVSTSTDLLYLYNDFAQQIKTMRDTKALSGVVYTQLTDVETELNGLMTYDRVPKVEPALLAKATRFEMPAPRYSEVAPTSEATAQLWRYTTARPEGKWSQAGFDDSGWTQAPAGFGRFQSMGKTPWKTPEIWMRRHFDGGVLTPDQIANLVVKDLHDGDIEVYINGVKGYSARGTIRAFEYRALSSEARAALKPGGDNVIAVHCVQRGSGQYIDAGVAVRVPAGE